MTNHSLPTAQIASSSDSLKQLADTLSKRQGLVAHVEEYLRNAIMGGQIKPGERIVETRVARQLGISQPVVREALKTMEAVGLVTRELNRGCSVITLTPAEIGHISTLQVELEVLAVRLVMETSADARRQGCAKLFAVLERMKAAARHRDAKGYFHCDLEFHLELCRLTGNPFLEKSLSYALIPLFAFVMIKGSGNPRRDLERIARQHERVVQAMMTGDTRHAMRILRQVLTGLRKQSSPLLI
jgi:DNA-binding GntR family transcriptional regulator